MMRNSATHKANETQPTRVTWPEATVIATSLGAFIAAGLLFARLQNVWIDETTQLSGATLGLRQLLAWLTGSTDPGFGVPPDRMPPLSYLIDSACAHTICEAPFSFRLLHLAIAAIGVTALLDLVAKRYGLLAVAVAGIMLALSPRLIETAVEVRAYPILFAITCLQVRIFFRLVDIERWQTTDLIPFFVTGVAATYTHFFGLVSTMSLVVGLFACRCWRPREVRLIILMAVLLLICSAGLLPFVRGAAKISGAEHVTLGPRSMIALAPRVIAHPANMVRIEAALLFLVPILILLLITFARVMAGVLQESHKWLRTPITGVAAALLSGFLVTVLASMIATKFDPLKPSYSGWMLPMVAVLAGAGMAQSSAWIAGLLLPMLIGAAWGDLIFLRNSEFFVHGPQASIAEAIGEAQPGSTSVIYVGSWPYGFFPTWFGYRNSVAHWELATDGSLHAISKGGGIIAVPTSPTVLRKSQKIVVVEIQLHHFDSLRELSSQQNELNSSAAQWVQSSVPGVRLVAQSVKPGLYWTRLSIFRKTQ